MLRGFFDAGANLPFSKFDLEFGTVFGRYERLEFPSFFRNEGFYSAFAFDDELHGDRLDAAGGKDPV